MKNLYLHEFERHLRKAHLRTHFWWGWRRDNDHEKTVEGFMTNELITRGAIFKSRVEYYHPVGRPDQVKFRSPQFDRPLLGQSGFQYLDETGGGVSSDTVCEMAFAQYPELMDFDTPVPDLREFEQEVTIFRDDHRTYCLQARGRPDLVFDGIILDWGYVEAHMFDEDGCLWVDQTMFETSDGKYVALEEPKVLRNQKCQYRDRKISVFDSEEEAYKWLYGRDIKKLAIELEAKLTGDHGQLLRGTEGGAQIIPFPRPEPSLPGKGTVLELVKPAPV